MKKTVMITGGAKGIGKAMCEAFAQEGYALILHYNRSGQEAEILKKYLEGNYGVQVTLLQANFADKKQVAAMLKQIEKENLQIDTLILNAGVSYSGLFSEMSAEEIDGLFQVNVLSQLYLAKEMSRQMVRRKAGNILSISSIWGMVGASCEVVYSATKAALIGFTKALAKELALSGVRVNCIAPGAVETDMMGEYTEDELNILKKEIPMGRMGTPKEIGDLAVFLVGERAGYLTGQVLSPNGGIVL